MPSRSARTIAVAIAAGVTLGGGIIWFHSSSIGPGNRLMTRTPAARISARRFCDSEWAAAFDAENVPCAGKFDSAKIDSRFTQAQALFCPSAARPFSAGPNSCASRSRPK